MSDLKAKREYQAIPIGVDSYKKIIDKPYYYVDKTLFIKELLDKGGEVNLFTRPRRFGKTLALSTIKSFFEKEIDWQGNVIDNSRYFRNTKIQKTGEEYICHQQQYPVISMSLKSAKQPNFEMAYASLLDEIIKEYKRHRYVLEGGALLQDECEKYQKIMLGKAGDIDYAKSMEFLSKCLSAYHGKKTIILIDEYDVPLENAYFRGFYNKMIDFIRSLFESALKTNDNLEFAVITGCLRISRESIFTGLNNLKINSITDENCAEYFGFTPTEVEQMLADFDVSYRLQEVKEWYDGYLLGTTEVYNPWSMLNYLVAAVENSKSLPKPYWSNTSSNSIVRTLIERADDEVKEELEILIQGGTIEKPIHEDITYEDIDKSQDNLWNFLFFTGYLTKVSEKLVGNQIYAKLSIPNREIEYIYENTLQEWFRVHLEATDLSELYQAVLEGDCDKFAEEVTEQLLECISYNDYKEDYYHGFLCGLLKGCKGYRIASNRESGTGRHDIVMRYPSSRGQAMIMELKVAGAFDELEAGCDKALAQIEEQKYDTELRKDGYRNIIKYGICFYKKECMVKKYKIIERK